MVFSQCWFRPPPLGRRHNCINKDTVIVANLFPQGAQASSSSSRMFFRSAAAALQKTTAPSAETPACNQQQEQQQQHIIILGGGIAGLSTARYLLGNTQHSRNIKVTVIDRNIDVSLAGASPPISYEQQQTDYLHYSIPSRRNGNVLCPSLTIPWTTRSLWKEAFLPGIKSLFSSPGNGDSRPSITFEWQSLVTDKAMYSFGTHFLLQKYIYGRPEHQSNKSILDYNMKCLDDPSDKLIQSIQYGRFAEGTRLLDGSIKDEDSSGDIGLFCRGLLHQLTIHYEDRFKFASGESVHSFLLTSDKDAIDGVVTLDKNGIKSSKRADKFVIAMGVESTALCDTIKVPCPVYPVKGHLATISSSVDCKYNITLPNGIGYAAPMDYLDSNGRRLYRLSGFVDFTPQKEPDRDRINALINAAKIQLNNDVELIDASACHRPFSADDRPIVGPVLKFSNLYLCTGFGSRGWSVGLGSGSLLATMILGLPYSIDPEQYLPKRFGKRYY